MVSDFEVLGNDLGCAVEDFKIQEPLVMEFGETVLRKQDTLTGQQHRPLRQSAGIEP